MKRQYRIIETGIGHFPQTRYKRLFFYSQWKRIGNHPEGEFGLYDCLRYPGTLEKCKETIEAFDKWVKKKNQQQSYIKYEIGDNRC